MRVAEGEVSQGASPFFYAIQLKMAIFAAVLA
jgi:hypothetical protein